MDNLTPIAQAALTALTELGQGTEQQVRDKTRRSKTTTDKALADLAKAGLIVAVDPDPDAPANTPPLWRPTSTRRGTRRRGRPGPDRRTGIGHR